MKYTILPEYVDKLIKDKTIHAGIPKHKAAPIQKYPELFILYFTDGTHLSVSVNDGSLVYEYSDRIDEAMLVNP